MNKNSLLLFPSLMVGGVVLLAIAFSISFLKTPVTTQLLTASISQPPILSCPFDEGFTPANVFATSSVSLKQEALLLKAFLVKVEGCNDTYDLNTCLALFQEYCVEQGKCTTHYSFSQPAVITPEIKTLLCSEWTKRYVLLYQSSNWSYLQNLFTSKGTSIPSWLSSARNSYLAWKNQQNSTTTTTRISTSGGTGVSGTGETGYGMSQISGSTENLLGTFIDLNHPRLNLGAGTMEVYTKDTSLKEGKLICDGKQVGFGFNAQYWPGLWLQNMETENVRQDANCQLILTSSTGQTSSYSFKFGDLYGKGIYFTGFNKQSASVEKNSHFYNLNIVTSNIAQNGQMILEFKLQYLNGQNLSSYSKVEIKDANGNIIKTIDNNEARGWYNPMSLSLPQGVYTINLYSGLNLIESRSIGLDNQGKLTSETKALGATGWGSAFYPKSGGSGHCLNNNCFYTLNMQATGGTRYTIVDENGNLLYSAAIPPSGNIALQLSDYVGKNQKYYFVVYTVDENGNEIVATIQEGATDDKGFVDSLVAYNYKFGYLDCGGGILSLPSQFKNNSTKITDSSGNQLNLDDNGWFKKADLVVGQTYTLTTVVNGQTITYTFTYTGRDTYTSFDTYSPIIVYGTPNIVQSGNNLKVCPYVCVGSSLCDQSAAGYYCASGSVCCEKTHSIFTSDCPGQSGFVGYSCYNTKDCKGGPGIGYKCPAGQTCCKPNLSPPPPPTTTTTTSSKPPSPISYKCTENYECQPVAEGETGISLEDCQSVCFPIVVQPSTISYECTEDYECQPVAEGKNGISLEDCQSVCFPIVVIPLPPTTKTCPSYQTCEGTNCVTKPETVVDENATCPTGDGCPNDCKPIGCPEKGCGDYMKCVNDKCVDNCYGISCPRGTYCHSTKTGHECTKNVNYE